MWSLIVSFLGDAVLPRGGVVQAGVISEFGELAGIDPGLVRTALSRLVTRQTVSRERRGRNSFYRLTAQELAAFRSAADRIYGRKPANPTGLWDVLLLDACEDRARTRERAVEAGFAPFGSTTMVRPQHVEREAQLDDAWWFAGEMNTGDPAQLWPLAEIAASYGRFIDRFTPVAQAATLSNADALLARVLLAHEYRRIILRDPVLPPGARPARWPADDARALFDRSHAQLSPGADRWLDQHMS